MPATTPKHSPQAKRSTLNLRISPQAQELIKRAAEARGTNITDFVLDAARRSAEATLLDRTFFHVSPEVYEAFLQRLDAPPVVNERLRRTLTTPAPWEREASPS